MRPRTNEHISECVSGDGKLSEKKRGEETLIEFLKLEEEEEEEEQEEEDNEGEE